MSKQSPVVFRGTRAFNRETGEFIGRIEGHTTRGFWAHLPEKYPKTDDGKLFLLRRQAVSYLLRKAQESCSGFKLTMVDCGDHQKIKVIKTIRKFTGLSLKEAKAASEGAFSLHTGVLSFKEAEGYRGELEAAGAKVAMESV